jgi:hypothetical protein
MSDWLSQIGGVSSALSGLDMAMPGDGYIPFLGEAYWVSDPSVANMTLPPYFSILLLFTKYFEIYESLLMSPARHTSSPLPF